MSPLNFDLPKNNSNVIKVIGVGGGGSNAVNYMYSKGIQGVDFVVCNTDSQALGNSPIPVKIQLGASLTEGLGAGADPEIGEQSALESASEIAEMFGEKTKMVFITVGMGGGTGTGAAPVIAKIARERNLLTVGIVTTPFSFEGKTRNEQAQKGIDKLRENVDSLIVINNNKLREVYGNLGFKAGFSKADEVLATAARGIAEVITHHYTQNIDFRDAKTVLENSGSAIMGSAKASGQNRAQEAITKALESPLLNDNKITGAKNVLLLIVSGTDEKNEITIDEIGEINDYIQSEAKTNVNIIMGVGEEESLGEAIAVTIVATGFNIEQQEEIAKVESKRIIYDLDDKSVKMQTSFDSKKSTTKKQIESLKSEEIKEIEKTEKIIHKLIDDTDKTIVDSKTGQISLFDIDVTDVEFISKKSVKVEDNEKKGFLNKEITSALSDLKKGKSDTSFIDENPIVKTTQIIKEIPVIYNEVIDDEFIITQDISNIEVIDFTVVSPKQEEKTEESIFDLPLEQVLGSTEKIVKNDLDEAKQIEVIDTEIVSKNKVYTLTDLEELESELDHAKPIKQEKKQEEIAPELDFATKTVSKNEPETVDENSSVSPLTMTISELKKRSEVRKKKMKIHNYKFKNASKNNIDELEKQPAYKRNNVTLDELDSKSVDKSRTTINLDGDDLNLRSNNSFLHDNVD
jgi:cell division protein FtsZ